ncbi:MAG: tetratricopeptide repeat protein [Candidatus Marinimicrobia bacterium]|nr:tetratricopeptide repeat protein [Candidatus Neomarinimicrobiota bacterium]
MTGYTSLMQKDEEKARELIERQRETVTPLVNKYGGKVLQYMGDGTFCSFESAIESVNCAIDIQKALIDQEQISLRIGIHVGDVVLKGEEVYGDGVNVASRLEPLAEPGGICISGRVYDDIRNQRNIEAVFLGEKDLKNVDRPIKVYALKGEALSTPQTESIPESQTHTERINRRRLSVIGSVLITILIGSVVLYLNMNKMSPDSGVKMLVVLPFENLGPAENEYFADGMTDEITSRLASISGLGVISRTSAMQYKNHTKSAEQIGRELGAQYILEGTIRYQSVGDNKNRVRITPQLIRVSDDTHLWATTYDGFMEEIFELQTNIAEKVAAAMDITLLEPERRELKREHTKNLEAYDYYLRGNDYFNRGTEGKNLTEATNWYRKAVELDPTFALAYARLSLAYTNLYWYGGAKKEHQMQAEKAVLEAFRLSPNLTEAHLAYGEFQNKVHEDYDEALEHFTIALKKQPNNADVYAAVALVQKRQGDWEESIKNYKRATMLDPLSPIKALETGQVYLYMRDYLEAEKYIGRARTLNPYSSDNYTYEAWLYLLSDGNKERAERVVRSAGTVDLNKIMAGAKSLLWGMGLWRFDLLNEEYDESVNALTPGSFANDRLTYLLSKAQLYALMDDEKFQYSYYDSARMLLEEQVKNSPKVFKLYSMLGFVCANLGLREQAIEAGLKAVEIMPISLCHY